MPNGPEAPPAEKAEDSTARGPAQPSLLFELNCSGFVVAGSKVLT